MADPFAALEARFGEALLRDEPLVRYTVARLGGPADALVTAHSCQDLAEAVGLAHEAGLPWLVLGGGANVLIADRGVRGLVIVNHARGMAFEDDGRVWAESGASLSTVARKASNGAWAVLSGANVPLGRRGGGRQRRAHGGEIARQLIYVDLLDSEAAARRCAGPRRYALRLRASAPKDSAVASCCCGKFQLKPGHDPKALNERIAELAVRRKRTSAPGRRWAAFKNPPASTLGG